MRWLARVRTPGGRLSLRQLEAHRRRSPPRQRPRRPDRAREPPDPRPGRGRRRGAGAEVLPRATCSPRSSTSGCATSWRPRWPGAIPPARCHRRHRRRARPRALRRSVLAALPGRFLFAVDDGGGMAADPRADIALIAEPGGRPTLTLALAGRLTTLSLPPPAAIDERAARRRTRSSTSPRPPASDRGGSRNYPAGPRPWRTRSRARPRPDRLALSRTRALGTTVQNDGRAAVTVLPPLGRLDLALLGELLPLVAGAGTEVRLSSARTLTLPDVAGSRGGALLEDLASRGLRRLVRTRGGTACRPAPGSVRVRTPSWTCARPPPAARPSARRTRPASTGRRARAAAASRRTCPSRSRRCRERLSQGRRRDLPPLVRHDQDRSRPRRHPGRSPPSSSG